MDEYRGFLLYYLSVTWKKKDTVKIYENEVFKQVDQIFFLFFSPVDSVKVLSACTTQSV